MANIVAIPIVQWRLNPATDLHNERRDTPIELVDTDRDRISLFFNTMAQFAALYWAALSAGSKNDVGQDLIVGVGG